MIQRSLVQIQARCQEFPEAAICLQALSLCFAHCFPTKFQMSPKPHPRIPLGIVKEPLTLFLKISRWSSWGLL